MRYGFDNKRNEIKPGLVFLPIKIKKDLPGGQNWLKLGFIGQNWSKLKLDEINAKSYNNLSESDPFL